MLFRSYFILETRTDVSLIHHYSSCVQNLKIDVCVLCDKDNSLGVYLPFLLKGNQLVGSIVCLVVR